MTLEDVIKSDPTLNYLINDAHIDWWNTWQVHLRCQALKLAMWIYINKKY